ncbi:MAG TPA: hypothetical protein VF414_19005 [Thermoanaerobaculia bacterium]
MDHSQIDAENVAERYVTGRLSPEEAATFEEHYLDCPQCCARVDAAQRLERGMRRLAEEAAAGFPEVSRPARWSPSPRLALAAAALLAVALLPAGLGLRQVRQLRGEVSEAREALARAQAQPMLPESSDRLAALERELQGARRDLAAEAEKREALAREVESARRPQVNLPVLPLTPVRGGVEGPPRTVALPREPGWIALWAEPGDTGFPAYRATLRSARGAEVFQASGLELNDLGALLVTVHSTSLDPGDYRLEIDGLPRSGAPVAVGRFHLRVVARG